MPDFNDVVRHVILRILVDQESLAGELQKAKQSLKGLEDAERESNKRRAKDSEQVTKAVEKQTAAVHDNAQAHKRNHEEAGRSADQIRDAYTKSTQEIKDGTKALNDQSAAAAKIRRDDENARASNFRKDVESIAGIARKDREAAIQVDDLKKRLESERDKQNKEYTARSAVRIREIAAELDKLEKTIEINVIERDHRGANRDLAASEARRGSAIADDTENAVATNAVRRRRELLHQERLAKQAINQESLKGQILEQSLLNLVERRGAAEDRWLNSRRRGLAGLAQSTGALMSDVAVAGARAVISAPRTAARRAAQALPRDQVADFDTPVANMRRTATDGERQLARLFSRIRRDGQESTAVVKGLQKGWEAFTGALRSRAGAAVGPEVLHAIRRDSAYAGAALAGLKDQATGFFASLRDNIRNSARISDNFTGMRSVAASFTQAREGASRFFNVFRRDGADALDVVQRVRAGIRGFVEDINRSRAGGSGSSLFKNLAQDARQFINSFDGIGGIFSNLFRHFVSFQTLILAVIAAFGPLAAILGAVGAGALGLVSNLGALAGVLFALPGLISAAVSGFGALALIIAPLSKAFSAFSAAQDAAGQAAVKGSRDAANAARALVDAQRRLEDADTRVARSKEDLVRAEDRLARARKQAKRDIEDYEFALRKLRYEEEGAALGVEQAEQDYRRTLADPTANSLARRQAAHGLEGAKFDQEEQNTANLRLVADAAEAIKKGVEGADAVVDALRGVVDANRAITDSLRDQKRANEDLSEAQKDADAGGSAARTAAEKLEAELAKLGPQTRKVVEALLALSGAWRDMQKRVSDRFFKHLTDDSDRFAQGIKIIEAFLGPAADAMGKLADQALKLFTNKEWTAFFASQGAANAKTIADLGDAAISAAGGFKNIIEIARPFTDFVTEGIAGMADSFERFTDSENGRKSIKDFLDLTMKRMRELKPVVRDLFLGFAGFFKALNSTGDGRTDFTTWFNQGLQRAAARFRELGEMAQDPNGGFQKWLRDVRPLLSTVVSFLAAAGRFFGDLFSNPANLKEAEAILRAIADQWLPKLAEIFDKLSTSELISSLAEAIGQVFEGVVKFFDSGGLEALGKFSDALVLTGMIFNQIISALSAIPGLITVIGTVAAVVFGTAFAAKFSGLLGLVKLLQTGLGGVVNLFKSVRNEDDGSNRSTGRRAATRTWDNVKDKALRQDQGTSAAERRARDGLDGRTTAPKVDLTGTGGVESHLTRMERLLIEIRNCVCRMGGRGTGGRGADRRPGSTGGDSRSSSRTTSTRSSSTRSRSTSVFPDVDGDDTRLAREHARNLRQTEIRNTDPGPETLAQRNAARARAGLPPLATPANRSPFARPSTINNQLGRDTNLIQNEYRQQRDEVDRRRAERERIRDERNSPEGRERRLNAVAESQDRRLRAAPGAEAVREQQRRNSRAGRDQRLNDVVESRERRTRGLPGGTVPSFNRYGQTRDDEFLNTVDPPEQTVRRPKRNQSGYTGERSVPVQPSGVPDRPRLADPSFAVPPRGLDDNYYVPRSTEVSGQPKPPRGPGGRIISPYATNTGDLDAPRPAPNFPAQAPPSRPRKPAQTRTPGGQFGPRPSPTAQIGSGLPDLPQLAYPTNQPRLSFGERLRRNLRGDSGSFGAQPGLDFDDDDDRPQRQSPFSRFRTSLRNVFDRTRNDSGSIGVGSLVPVGPSGDDDDRRSRPGRRPSRSRPRPGRPGSRRSSRRPGGVGYGEGYDDGYDDALGGGLSPDLPDGDDDRRKSRRERREEKRRERRQRRAERRTAGGRGRGGGRPRPSVRGRRGGTADLDEDTRTRRGGVDFDDDDGPRTRRGGVRGLLGGAEEAAEGAARGGRFARFGGGLARGVAGGVGGLAASLALSYGGDALINKYVKNDKDAGSLSRGVGAVASGAGIGAMIGSVVPGVGTLIGGAVGGLAGGAYSLYKDKNLRNFVGDKLGGAAKAVGGFVGGVGGALGGLFGGDKDDDKGGGRGDKLKGALKGFAGGGLVGALLGGTDIGKSILDSLKKAGAGIGQFFTRTIPGFFSRGMRTVTDFFTKTLPKLPGLAFDAFFIGIGRIGRFFTTDLPNAISAAWGQITSFFTETLPAVTAAAWAAITGFFTETLPSVAQAAWDGITTFFTETLPNAAQAVWDNITTFFTETLPGAAQMAWDGITNFFTVTLPEKFTAIVTSMTTFFSETLPNFFTQTLPNAIAKLPGMVKSAVVDPVVEFFSSIGDKISEGWDAVKSWAGGLFDRAGRDIAEGYGKHSGGLIEGVYQGIQDTVLTPTTVGEYVVRKGTVDQPGAKAFLRDFNDGRITMADLYGGLSATTAPQVMSIVPPDAQSHTAAIPTVVNNTVNHAPLMGNVTIHNPKQEPSERSLRRQVEIAAIRHRR